MTLFQAQKTKYKEHLPVLHNYITPSYTNRVLLLSTNMISISPQVVRREGGLKEGRKKEKIERANSQMILNQLGNTFRLLVLRNKSKSIQRCTFIRFRIEYVAFTWM